MDIEYQLYGTYRLGVFFMKSFLNYLGIFTLVFVLVSGCTKKNSSGAANKAKEKTAKELADEKAKQKAKAEGSDIPLPPSDPQNPESSARSTTPAPVQKPPAEVNNTTTDNRANTPVTGPANPTRVEDASRRPPSPPPAAVSSDWQKCMNEKTEALIAKFKTSNQTSITVQFLITTKNTVISDCRNPIASGSPLHAMLIQTLTEKANSAFPDSLASIQFFKDVELDSSGAEEKARIYAASRTKVEIQSKSVRYFGDIDQNNTKDNIVTYSINRATGDLTAHIQPFDAPAKSQKVNLDNLSRASLKYRFDFTLKENMLGTITVIEGENELPLEFKVINGDFATFKTNKNINILFTQDSWQKLLKIQLQNLALQEFKQQARHLALFTKVDATANLVRTCTINTTSIACTEPDHAAKLSVVPLDLIK